MWQADFKKVNEFRKDAGEEEFKKIVDKREFQHIPEW